MSEDDIERSESGSPIYRHQENERDWTPAEDAGRNLEAVEEHVEEFIGPVETVFHELLSDLIHLDVLFIPADEDRPYHALVTSGVSDLPMTVPAGMDDFSRVELMMALPPDWPLDENEMKKEENYWPIRWLKQIGRLPHDYNTWIGYGHTIPNGDPAEKIENTNFVGFMLTPAYWLPPEFLQKESSNGDIISFFNLLPLYQDEMDFKLKKGAEELELRFEKRNLSMMVDVDRPSAVKKKIFPW